MAGCAGGIRNICRRSLKPRSGSPGGWRWGSKAAVQSQTRMAEDPFSSAQNKACASSGANTRRYEAVREPKACQTAQAPEDNAPEIPSQA